MISPGCQVRVFRRLEWALFGGRARSILLGRSSAPGADGSYPERLKVALSRFRRDAEPEGQLGVRSRRGRSRRHDGLGRTARGLARFVGFFQA